ncbi:hypothetical protein PMAYCL1PPCAC_22416, partial [Pristionchus mayeri]
SRMSLMRHGGRSIVALILSCLVTDCVAKAISGSEILDSDAPCTGKWTKLPDGMCYRVSTEPQMNIYDAEMLCRNYGGHLPSISSSEQSDIIQAYLAGKNYQNQIFWIGLYCMWEDRSPEEARPIAKRAWIDGTLYADYSNFLNPDDDTDTCSNPIDNDSFAYNGALKGKWQRQMFNWTMTT